MPFQGSVNTEQALGVLGDFCSMNPRATVNAPQGGFVSGAAGVAVGLFAWADPAYQKTVSNSGYGAPTGFVHREQQALITVFLAEYSNVIPSGMPVVLHQAGDFFVKNAGANSTSVGMKAYANYATGVITFAATGNPTVGASATGVIAAASAVVTGTIGSGGVNNNTLTVTAVSSGTLVQGAALSGTGIQSGTLLGAQVSGTTGGIGTYEVNIPQYVASTSITAAYGQLTISGTVTGAFAVGDLLSGTGVAANTFITALGTGAGGTGTYFVNNNTAVSSATISANSNIETKWFAVSEAAPGELVKMSSWALG